MKLSNVRRTCCRCISTTLIILLCVLSLFGCGRGSTVVGKYLDEKRPQEFTELKSDGTFLIHQGNLNSTGKYSVEGKIIKLVFSSGVTTSGTIDGKTLVGNGEVRWTKP